MAVADIYEKSGTCMGQISANCSDAALARLDLRRDIFVYSNTINSILNAIIYERTFVDAASWEVAKDRMDIRL